MHIGAKTRSGARAAWALGGALAVLAGCASQGVGSGRLQSAMKPEAEGPVEFAWRTGMNTTRGDISATLLDGRRFEGTFTQITSSNVSQNLDAWAPMGGATYGAMRGGAYWEPVDATSFSTHYSGRVVAELEAPTGERMRCLFVLADPVAGPQGGGSGECELSTGERVGFARLAPSD